MATIIAQQLSAGCVPFRDAPISACAPRRVARGVPTAKHRSRLSPMRVLGPRGRARGGRTRLGIFPPFRCGARPHRSSIRARPGRPDGSRFTDDPRLTDHALSIRVFFR
jgi:hypothetical protein